MQCEIIIPIWNQLEYTKQCLESLFNSTHLPFRLILVDNASNCQTAQYLDNVRERNPERVVLIRNRENLGFIKAVNRGIKESQALYVCLLNNDTCLTSGWLQEMINIAEAKEDIGIVNPNSNTLGLKPRRGESPDKIAQKLKSCSGEYADLPMASGFCMLIKRKVIHKVGLLDEIYGMGYFEDADYSKRVEKSGFRCVCARAAYVYHQERGSFIKFKKFDQNFARNRQIFYDKWGRPERLLYVLSKDDPKYERKIAQEALKLARQGNIVWFLLRGENRHIDTHPNIQIYKLPKDFFSLISFWRILKRKKKFDKIYVDDRSYANKLNNFKAFHKAEVIYGQ